MTEITTTQEQEALTPDEPVQPRDEDQHDAEDGDVWDGEVLA